MPNFFKHLDYEATNRNTSAGKYMDRLIKRKRNKAGIEVVVITREEAKETYRRLCLGNAIGFGIAHGLSDDELMEFLPGMISEDMRDVIKNERKNIDKSIRRNRERLHFI